LEYANKRVQVNQDGLKLYSPQQLLVYADDVNILGGSGQKKQKNAEALTAASKENRLEVIADKLSTWSCFEIRTQDEITV
jgi:hypothetical protein